MSDRLRLLGARLTPDGVSDFVEQMVTSSTGSGKQRTPICIWGVHGIGKTALVEELAQRNNWRFAYVAPAQFEEMGDLHGLPRIEGDTTAFAKPEWVPTEPGPGVLLLDDLNRADDRILRGLMQLLQRHELASWSLPDDWHIVVTANPEGGDYSVTPLDDAMVTRMLHVSMEFDSTVWARWAIRAGIDERGIDFVLTYPEVVNDARTTPRSLTQFFERTAAIDDLSANRQMVHTLALSTLDAETATSFLAFVDDGLSQLISPTDILDGNESEIRSRVTALAHDDNGLRLDRLNTISVRLFLHVTEEGFVPTADQGKNLVAFLKHESLPNDLRVMLHRDLVAHAGKEVIEVMRDRELAELALSAL